MDESTPQRVVVVDVRMPFLSMVRFMVKWAIAAIPAIIILILLGTVFSSVIIGLFTGVTHKV